MATEVTVQNPAYWSDKPLQLAQLLSTANPSQIIGDPTAQPPDPERMLTLVEPSHWSASPQELEEVLRVASSVDSTPATDPGAASGASSASQDRLTLTVEEAAAALGISRAFAYEAVQRNEIPHVRIGRRILIPRAALTKMLDGTADS